MITCKNCGAEHGKPHLKDTCQSIGEEIKMKTFPPGTQIIDLNNLWIPGNSPGKEGTYEISFKTGFICVAYYFKDRWVKNCLKSFNMGEWEKENVIAYSPIKLKKPYQAPVPERKLACPFCRSVICDLIEDREFDCQACGAVLHETRERVFEIYDKLNEEKS